MIVYFSGTGNSYYVAKSLLNEGETLVDVMTTEKAEVNGERLGIVYPCYCSEMPPLLIDFLNKSVVNKPKYTFAVCTCGASAGASFSSIKYILCGKGATLDFAEKIVMPDSCVMLAFPPKTVKKLLDKQDEKIAKIKAKIDASERKEVKAKKPMGIKSKLVWLGFGHFSGIYRKKSTDACVGCGKCVSVCKANNIVIKDGKAKFGKKENCYECFACINTCPYYAIKFGTVKNTPERRYMHPIYSGEKE